MGNKHSRKPSKKISIPLSTTSSNSSGSGLSPKSTTKCASQSALRKDEKLWPPETSEKLGERTGEVWEVNGSFDERGIEKQAASSAMGFKSWKTGTLDTAAFQPSGYIPKKVQSAVKVKEMSIQMSVAGTSGKSSGPATPTMKQANESKQQKHSAGVEKIQGLISQIQQLPPLGASRHAKYISDASTAQSSASANSVATSRTTPNQTPVKNRETIVRVDPRKKDIVISATGITRNRFHVDELELVDGFFVYQPNAPSDSINTLGEIAEKDEAVKEQFWLNHHVQIIVDLRENSTGIPTDPTKDAEGKDITVDLKGKAKEVVITTIIDHMANLGVDFFKYATRISIDLLFPTPPASAATLRTFGPRGTTNNHTQADFSTAVTTPGFHVLEQLAAKLDNCLSIELLEVVIQNPASSNSQPFTVEQLMYCLPFYDLRFEDWQVKWQGSYMTNAVDVGRFPLILLDKERTKWLYAKQKAQREAMIAARKEQERIDSMVFVTRSIAPEWQEKTWLPQPFPSAPQSSNSQSKHNAQGNMGI